MNPINPACRSKEWRKCSFDVPDGDESIAKSADHGLHELLEIRRQALQFVLTNEVERKASERGVRWLRHWRSA
jgi:hypothetical protein